MKIIIFFSGKYFPEIIDLIYNYYFLPSLLRRHFGGFCNGVLRITYRCVGSTHPIPFRSMMGGDTSMYRWYMLWQAKCSSRSLNGQSLHFLLPHHMRPHTLYFFPLKYSTTLYSWMPHFGQILLDRCSSTSSNVSQNLFFVASLNHLTGTLLSLDPPDPKEPSPYMTLIFGSFAPWSELIAFVMTFCFFENITKFSRSQHLWNISLNNSSRWRRTVCSPVINKIWLECLQWERDISRWASSSGFFHTWYFLVYEFIPISQ